MDKYYFELLKQHCLLFAIECHIKKAFKSCHFTKITVDVMATKAKICAKKSIPYGIVRHQIFLEFKNTV